MARNTKSNTTTLLNPVRSAAHGLELQGLRQIVSKTTGVMNYVLVFDGAEVVMPGTWTIRESEFPNGLYVGQKLNAYWAKDANGVDRFHLEEA